MSPPRIESQSAALVGSGITLYVKLACIYLFKYFISEMIMIHIMFFLAYPGCSHTSDLHYEVSTVGPVYLDLVQVYFWQLFSDGALLAHLSVSKYL